MLEWLLGLWVANSLGNRAIDAYENKGDPQGYEIYHMDSTKEIGDHLKEMKEGQRRVVELDGSMWGIEKQKGKKFRWVNLNDGSEGKAD